VNDSNPRTLLAGDREAGTLCVRCGQPIVLGRNVRCTKCGQTFKCQAAAKPNHPSSAQGN